MRDSIRVFLVILLCALSVFLARPYFFMEKDNTFGVVVFGLASAAFWFISAVVHIFVPSPARARITNADLANATAAVIAGCLVLINVKYEAFVGVIGKPW